MPENPLAIPQSDAKYTTVSLSNRKCAGCSHYMKGRCNIVASEPLPIVDKGSCTHWVEKQDGQKRSAIQPYQSDLEDDELYTTVYNRVFEETHDAIMAELAARGMLTRRRMGLATKSTKDGITIAGWAIMFGDPVVKDLDRTYFASKETQFNIDHYPRAPLWWMHCQDPAYGVSVIGERTVAQVYEHGIWMEHKLYTDHPLFERTLHTVESGKIFYSTDSLTHVVNRAFNAVDRALLSWPLAGCSLVTDPAEPGLGEVIRK
jgi:hypothetical protein